MVDTRLILTKIGIILSVILAIAIIVVGLIAIFGGFDGCGAEPPNPPSGDTPGGDTPGGDTPGGDTPGGDTPGGDTPGGDTPGGDTPGGDTPGGDTPGGDTPGGDQSDSGNTNVNVTTGKLKVDIVDTTGVTLVNKTLAYQSAEGQPVQFAPGYTHYTQAFAVKNIGDIPLDFELYVNLTEDMKNRGFTEAFDVYITTDPEDPNAATDVQSFRGRLEKDQCSLYYYLVISMKTTAGNEFQGVVFNGIGITVNAVQVH